MNKSTLPVGIKGLKAWRDKGQLSFDHEVQRKGSQWTLLQQGLLVHSILMGYPTPPCYFLKMKNDAGETQYSVLDGKQRLTSLFDFIDGNYTLHSAVPPCKVDGFDFDLAGMSFAELADDLKDEILGCRMSIFCLEDCTDEEVEEIFTRLNNSTPLSPIQKCRSIMSSELSKWAKEICNMNFFQYGINLTLAQLRREADLEVLLQSMLLLDSRHEGYDDWKGISTAEVTKYCHHVRKKYNTDKRQMILEIVRYLGDAFKEQHKFLKKSNIPMIFVLAKIALENGVGADRFYFFVEDFSNSLCVDYNNNTGSGNVKRAKTEGRLKALAADFEAYFGFEDVNILGKGRDSDGGENSEAIGGLSSSEAVASDDGGSGDAEIESGEGEIEAGEADLVEEAGNGEAGEGASENCESEIESEESDLAGTGAAYEAEVADGGED